MSLVMGLVVIVIRVMPWMPTVSTRPATAYGFGLGVLMLAAGAVLAKRKPKMPDPEKTKQGFVSRMIADPRPARSWLA